MKSVGTDVHICPVIREQYILRIHHGIVYLHMKNVILQKKGKMYLV